MSPKWRWGARMHKKFVQICLALHNMFVTLHPVDAKDDNSYRHCVCSLQSTGNQIVREHKEQEVKRRARGRAPMSCRFLCKSLYQKRSVKYCKITVIEFLIYSGHQSLKKFYHEI